MRRHVLSIRRGMTLVEMLVAMAASLLLMAAIARAFAAFSGAMSNSRAILETDARLRSAAHRLRTDLQGVTTQMLPPRNPAQGEGYFEVIEGPLTDYQDSTDPAAPVAIVSGTTEVCPTDIDDVLLFTTRNTDTPFIGRVGSGTMESSTAEVAWFARPTPGTTGPVTYTLYRRQLLVMGYVGRGPFLNEATDGVDNNGNSVVDEFAETTPGVNNTLTFSYYGGTWRDFYSAPCDISARREMATGSFDRLVPNNLSDLTRRENRFMHNRGGVTDGTPFPFPFVDHTIASTSSTVETLPAVLEGLVFDSTSQRQGEDVVLTNVLAFDVRVFDATAPIRDSGNGTALVPGDPGFASGTDGGSGCYVDLGHGVTANSLITPINPLFSASTSTVGGSGDILTRTYCTWSTHYEADGINQDSEDEGGSPIIDEGTDGLDNDNNSLVDDAAEQETSPPYPYPLRGIEVRIRVYEPSSRQVRQVTVRQTFVPH